MAGLLLGGVLGSALFVRAPAQAPAVAGMAPAAEICPAGAAPALPPAMAGWASRAPVTAGASTAAAPALAVGRGVDAALGPASAVTFAAAPGKPAAPGSHGGMLSLAAPEAGTYAVGLSSAAWIDVVDARGATVASTAHGHGPPCSGLRKVVDFQLAPGRYVVQLTSAEPTVGVIAFRR